MIRIFGCNWGDPAFGSAVGFLCCLRQALKPLCVHVSGDNRPFFPKLSLGIEQFGIWSYVPFKPVLMWSWLDKTASYMFLCECSNSVLLLPPLTPITLSFELQLSGFLWLFLPVSQILKGRTLPDFSVIYFSCPVTRVWLCFSFGSCVWDRS